MYATVGAPRLERLRTIVFQHLGLRGRVLGEFYLRTQQEEESNLAVTAGYEKDVSSAPRAAHAHQGCSSCHASPD